jgi:predicted TIM-barrel fold metal-dependent hydrolase
MDIVDAQLHIGPGMIDTILEAMNSLGIKSVLIDEFWVNRVDQAPKQIEPGYRLTNGAWRAVYPVAQLASFLHPDRFSYLVRIERQDPDLASVMCNVASQPHGRAFRVLATWSLEEAEAFATGGYEPLLEIAQDIGLPVCMFIPGRVEYLARYLKKFPKLTVVLDHCGMGMPRHPPGRSDADEHRTMRLEYFDEVLKLAEYPNVAVKLSHAPYLFRAAGAQYGATQFPFDLARKQVRRAIQAFGAERLMWASDKTVVRGHTWSDLLHWLKDDPELSPEEKEWILGGTARRILKWPVD